MSVSDVHRGLWIILRFYLNIKLNIILGASKSKLSYVGYDTHRNERGAYSVHQPVFHAEIWSEGGPKEDWHLIWF